jgi:muramoyltetrapeptide carboxypeptidase
MPSAAFAPFPRLRVGDRIAVVAPSSPPPAQRVAAGLEALRGWGLLPEAFPSVTATHPTLSGLAGDDRLRAKDVADAWRDPGVRAIWCARGGYGVQRMLDLLPEGLFVEGEPKPIIGFSDVTPLLHAAMIGSGTQMVHGPSVVNLGELQADNLAQVHRLMHEAHAPRTLLTGLTPWVEGVAQGRLLGGNVALLAASIGTGDLPESTGSVILLEDVGQPAFVLDRGLTQLIRSGWLPKASGILLGDFSMDDDPARVDAVLRDRLVPLGIPVWSGAPVGHTEVNLALPLGSRVHISGGYLRLA